MSEARRLLPTDLLALVTYNGRRYPNAAWPRERLGAADRSSLPLGGALEQLLPIARGGRAWISARRQRLRGLIGARPLGAKQAWEIDYLVDATRTYDALPGLLDCAIADIGRAGAEKLFLRLAASHGLLRPAANAGFIPFREDVLYARVGLPAGSRRIDLRPMDPGDSYPAYRLYTAATPEATRRCEAATFSEWHAAQEKRWLRSGRQFVSESRDGVAAVVRVARLPQGVVIDLLVGDRLRDSTQALVRGAVEAAGGESLPIFVLAPRLSGLAASLEDAGFDAQGEYVSLFRRTTRPLSLPKLTPAIAKTAIGA